ncbi:MAG: EAL domain-containing protein [Sciscionella sp.]
MAAQAEFAQRWANAVLSSSLTALSEAQAHVLFAEFVEQARSAAEDDLLGTCTRIGQRMIAEHFTGIDALGISTALLSTDLLKATGLPEDDTHRIRVARIVGEVSAGYVAAMRERIFAEQETIKRALLDAERETEQRRRELEKRYEAVFESSAIGVTIVDLAGRALSVNPALAALLGTDVETLCNADTRTLVHPDDLGKLTVFFTELVSGTMPTFSERIRFFRGDGEPVWTITTATMVHDAQGEPDYVIATIENTSELNLLRGEYGRHIVVDLGTGLANASKFRSALEEVLGTASPGTRVGVCFIDLDGFRVINDGLGRAAGDEMLQRVASMLVATFGRHKTVIARVAGDGFAVLIKEPESAGSVLTCAGDLLTMLEEPLFVGDVGMAVSASIGIVVEPAAEFGVEELIHAAEITLHRAKANGKAQWLLYDPKLHELDQTRFHLGATLPGALEHGQFEVVYRPVCSTKTGSTVSAYATVRWHHPELGLLGPRDFIELAEETGMIMPLGKWVINSLAEQITGWQHRFGVRAPKVGLSIAKRIANDQDLVLHIKTALERHGAQPELLCVGVPATCLSPSPHRLIDVEDSLHALAANRVRSAAEGFGTGEASLLNLRELPLAELLLAPRVADTLREDPPVEVLRSLTGSITLAHDMGLPVTAFGADTPEVSQRLASCGVDALIGSAYGASRPAVEFTEFWAAHLDALDAGEDAT